MPAEVVIQAASLSQQLSSVMMRHAESELEAGQVQVFSVEQLVSGDLFCMNHLQSRASIFKIQVLCRSGFS